MGSLIVGITVKITTIKSQKLKTTKYYTIMSFVAVYSFIRSYFKTKRSECFYPLISQIESALKDEKTISQQFSKRKKKDFFLNSVSNFF